MLTSIKNGQAVKKNNVVQIKTKKCESILKILWDEGFISSYSITKPHFKNIKIFLKYKKTGEPVIKSIKCISKPGKRIYYSIKQIWKIDSTKNFIIFTTTKGFKSITDCKKLNLGGEPYFIIN
jgi:small subunit ribosomal protein S8